MDNIAIIGLGLMGGSLGLALMQREDAVHVSGYARREETRCAARERQVCHVVHECLEAAVADADIIVLCVPMCAMSDLLERIVPACKSGAVITDVGSTKATLVAQAHACLEGSAVHFVGSHPVAGSEQDGLEAAQADLYDGATVVVTPDHASEAAVESIKIFWRMLNAKVIVLTAKEHDRMLARTSHLSHLVAAVLAKTTDREDTDLIRVLCGTGFRDTTRLADGPPRVWRDIIETNAKLIVDELESMQHNLADLAGLINQQRFDDVEQFLADCRTARRRLLGGCAA